MLESWHTLTSQRLIEQNCMNVKQCGTVEEHISSANNPHIHGYVKRVTWLGIKFKEQHNLIRKHKKYCLDWIL